MESLIYRFELPRMVRRGSAETLDFELAGEGAIVLADLLYSLIDENGSAVIDEEQATYSGNAGSYALIATKLDSEDYGDRFVEHWKATLNDGRVRIFTREFYLGPRIPLQNVTDTDLEALIRDIGTERPPELRDWGIKRNEAWAHLLSWIIARGTNPCTIRNMAALRIPHLVWWGLLVCRDLDTYSDGPGKWSKRAAELEQALEQQLATLQLAIDTDGDNAVDAQRSGQAEIWLTDIPSWGRRDYARRGGRR